MFAKLNALKQALVYLRDALATFVAWFGEKLSPVRHRALTPEHLQLGLHEVHGVLAPDLPRRRDGQERASGHWHDNRIHVGSELPQPERADFEVLGRLGRMGLLRPRAVAQPAATVRHVVHFEAALWTAGGFRI